MTRQRHEKLVHFPLLWCVNVTLREILPKRKPSSLLRQGLPVHHRAPAEENICVPYPVQPGSFPGKKVPTRRDLSKLLLLVAK